MRYEQFTKVSLVAKVTHPGRSYPVILDKKIQTF